MDTTIGDVRISDAGGHVALVEIRRPPNNFFDEALIRDLGEVTQAAAEDVAQTLERFVNGFILNVKRLRGFSNTDHEEILKLGRELALILLVTVGIFLTLRTLLGWVFRRLKVVTDESSTLRWIGVFAAAFVLDALIVAVSWAGGYAIGISVLKPTGSITLLQTLYLNAFLAVGLSRAVGRAVLAPSSGRPRPVPISDRSARYWSRWLTLVLAILGYGTLLIVPVVADIVNLFTARAVHVLVLFVVVVIGIGLAIRHRNDLPGRIEALLEERPEDITLRVVHTLSRLVWIAIVIWFAVLYVLAVSNLSLVAGYALATLKIVGAVMLGVILSNWLSGASDRGVTLPGGVTSRLPLLEERLNAFVPNFLQALRFIIMVAVLLYALHTVGLDVFATQSRSDAQDAFVATVLSVIIMVVAAFAVWLALSSWIDYRLTPGRGKIVTARLQTLLTLFRNAATIAIVAVTLMFSLSEIGIDIAPLIASAGVIGLAIGFGAQKLVQDIITGVFIQFENAINVGDYVEVGGIGGTVEKLTIRSVSLRDLYGTFHIVPFSSVDSVSNYMRGYGYHVADLGIAYREDTDEAREVMHRCFDELRSEAGFRFKVLGDLEWFGVQSLGDSAVVLRARIKCSPGNQWAVGRRYNELLKKACDAAGIEIPFPHMTVWFGEAKTGTPPPAHLRIDRPAATGASGPAGEEPARVAQHEQPAISAEPTADRPDSNA